MNENEKLQELMNRSEVVSALAVGRDGNNKCRHVVSNDIFTGVVVYEDIREETLSYSFCIQGQQVTKLEYEVFLGL